MNAKIVAVFIIALLAVGIGSYAVTNNVAYNNGYNAGKIGVTTEAKLLRINLMNTPSLDPATGGDEASSSAYPNIYDTLVYPAVGGSVPDVATNWTVSADTLTWTFSLRKDVTFHDGSNLTADDVKFSMDRFLTMGQGFSYIFEHIMNHTAVIDKYTVAFITNSPVGPFLAMLPRFFIVEKSVVMAHIVTPGSYGALGDYGKTYLMGADAGSGPYKVKSYNAETDLDLVEYNDYWGPTVGNNPTEVIFYWITTPTTVEAMMKKRELEISDIEESPQWYDSISTFSGIGIDARVFCGGCLVYLQMNTQKTPTDDIYVREAIVDAVDYASAISGAFPGSLPAAGPVPPTVDGWDHDLLPVSQNLTKALEELKQSKYYGQPSNLTISISYMATMTMEGSLATLVATNLATIGITANLEPLPWLTLTANCANVTTTPNIGIFMTGPDYMEAGSILNAKYSIANEGAYMDTEWMGNTTLDAEITAAISTIDRSARFQAYEELQKEVLAIHPDAFVANWVIHQAYQAAYIGWPTAQGLGSGLMGYDYDARYISVYPAKLAAL